MKAKPYMVRCYVLPREGLFFAGCITLNLTANGKTLAEAKKNLDRVIGDYIKVIAKGHKFPEFAHLLNRPAPAFMYFDYARCYAAHTIANTKKLFTFTDPLPLELRYCR